MRQLDYDLKKFVEIEMGKLCDNVDYDPKLFLPKKTEDFIQKVMKDAAGNKYENEMVHNMMHQFYRKAVRRGYDKILILGAFGMGKSLCRGNKILMYSGGYKKVEDVKVGDLLMGPDSKPRKVLFLGSGIEPAYRITLSNGDTFSCNESHILPLKVSKDFYGYKKGEKIDILLKEYLNIPEWIKIHCLKMYKVPIEFDYKEVSIDPYEYGKKIGNFRRNHYEVGTQFYRIWAHMKERCSNPNSKFYNCYGGRGISFDPLYLQNSKEIRLELLAGFLDAHGTKPNKKFKMYRVKIKKNKQLRDDLLFLGRSLGFSMSWVKCVSSKNSFSYIITFNGDICQIPCRINKIDFDIKKKRNRSKLEYSFKIEPIGNKEYFGFGLDGDHLFLHYDFTVSHNTEQMCIGLCLEAIAKDPNILIKIVHVSEDEAVNRVRAIRDYIENDDDFKEMCPHVKPSSIWGQKKFIVQRAGISVNATVQGYGILGGALGGRANLIVFDDPQDLKTAVLEPSTRENIEKAFKNTWITRLIPGNSKLLVLMNKWHQSLYESSELLEKSGLKFIKDFKVDDEVFTSNGIYEKVLKVHKGLYKGNLYKIIPYYLSCFDFECTHDHEVKTRYNWKYAHELITDDYLIVPIPKYTGDWKKECLKYHNDLQLSWIDNYLDKEIEQLPEWFHDLPENLFFEFLDRYSVKNKEDDNWIVSKSKTLLFQIHLNLLRFNIITSIEKITINCKIVYSLKIINTPKYAYIEGDNLYVKIRKIKTRPYFGYVYDITTPSHDFISPFVVHNSDLASYIQKNPNFAWMSISVADNKDNLIYKDSFGYEKLMPNWSKFPKEELQKREIDMGLKDYQRGFELKAYTDGDKYFPSFSSCCHFGLKPMKVLGDLRDWNMVGGIDFAGIKRPGTILSIVAVNIHTGLKVRVYLNAITKASDLADDIINTYKEFGTEVYMAENNATQSAIIDILQAKMGEDKYKRLGIKIEGVHTGKNKMDPLQGLPSMQKEMENKEWMFCYDHQFTSDDSDDHDFYCREYREFLHMPFYKTTDFVMAEWFASRGIRTLIRKGKGGYIY